MFTSLILYFFRVREIGLYQKIKISQKHYIDSVNTQIKTPLIL